MGGKVAIVIPIHKNILNSNERISLKRCFEVFSHYPIILAIPQGLDCTPFNEFGNFTSEVRFPDHFFASEIGYNKLMCLSRFYKKFLEYEYILIYQLDTFVFENNIDSWCKSGYDYIGAPWIESSWVNASFSTSRLRRFLHTRLNLVGNGGLSLRKVISSYKAARIFRPFAGLFKHEDFFWSNFVTRFKRSFRTAPVEEALKFAFEEHPKKLFERNNGLLPFGCHSWEKFDTDFWRVHFARYGHMI